MQVSRLQLWLVAVFVLAIAVVTLRLWPGDVTRAPASPPTAQVPRVDGAAEGNLDEELNFYEEQSAESVAVECISEVEIPTVDRKAIARQLSSSADPEHRLLAALFEGNNSLNIQQTSLVAAHREFPNNKLLLLAALRTCAWLPGAAACSRDDLERSAIRLDGENGFTWQSIAVNRLKRGDSEGALDALRRATTAANFSSYALEQFEGLERGLSAAGGLLFLERVTLAQMDQSAPPLNERLLREACDERATDRGVWLEHCANLGQRLEREGDTIYLNFLGLGLLKNVYGQSGNAQQMSEVDKKGKILAASLSDSFKGLERLGNQDRLLTYYNEQRRDGGERAALKALQAEAERLRQQPGYVACQGN
jgi:hypothetical protein